ncbi:N-acetyltransferase [Roseovarius sp. SCSIO 43702]|nr:N-acetyltransferase [Roseovarius sp. SCSIO 43702]
MSHEESDSKGRYVLRQDGAEAELTYSRLGATQVIADHTGVPDALRGTGAGRALVERLVADARADGFRIVPLCSFVKAMRDRHPDWADVFTG